MGARFSTRVAACGVALGVLASAGPARSQVNIEVVRRRIQDRPFQFTLEASFTGRLGNSQGSTFAVAGLAGGGYGHHRAFAQTSVDYAESFGVPTVAKAFGHLRYNYGFTPVVFGEAFAQVQSDQFQKLSQRTLFGFGPRFLLVSDGQMDLSLGTSYMFEFESLTIAPDEVFPTRRDAIRWNNYLSFGYRVGTTTEIVATLYVQPSLRDFGDVRALGEASLIFKVTKLLIARIGLTYRYQSRPPPDVLRSDLEVRNSLGVTF